MEHEFDRQDGRRLPVKKLKVPVPGEPVDPRGHLHEAGGPPADPRGPRPPEPAAESDDRLREARVAAAAGPMSPSSILMAVAGTSGAPQVRQRPGTRATAYDPDHPEAAAKAASGFADIAAAPPRPPSKRRLSESAVRETPQGGGRQEVVRAPSAGSPRDDDEDDEHFELKPRAEPAAPRPARTASSPTCPECRQELVRIVCAGAPLRVCVDCKGFWFPVEVVKALAESHDLFRQLASAVDMLDDAGLR